MTRTPPAIPPLGNVPTAPDAETRKGLNDFTGDGAPNRVLHINFGFFKYGTDDKGHAAALVLSMLLLGLTGIAGLIAPDDEWTKTLLQMLGSAFTLVAGVAIGQGISKKGGEE